MQDRIEEHKKLQSFWNIVKEKVEEAIHAKSTPEKLKEEIAWLWINCMTPANPDCEICNWHPHIELMLTQILDDEVGFDTRV